MSSQCKKDMDCRTKLINNTDETLWYDISCIVPSDSLAWEGNCMAAKVGANSSKEICSNETWEERFSRMITDTIIVWITNADTAEKYNMFEIIEGNKYYRKEILSQDDLIKMNYIISYP